MLFSVSLPYLNAGEPPTPLPTADAIRQSTDVLSDRGGEKLVGVGEFVVRYGQFSREREGNGLIFAQTILGIPVPTVWAMFREEGVLFIVMERIHGATLDVLWSRLSEQDKNRVMSKLSTVLEQMHSFVPSDQSFFGSVDGNVVPHHLFWTNDKDPTISGPFTNEKDFKLGLAQKIRSIAIHNNQPTYKADFYARSVDALPCHGSRFTHCDLQRKNIMVREVGQDDRLDDTFDVVLVDWEDAGYYPCYWEYFCAFTGFRWDDDWPLKMELALKPWPSETGFLYMMYKDL